MILGGSRMNFRFIQHGRKAEKGVDKKEESASVIQNIRSKIMKKFIVVIGMIVLVLHSICADEPLKCKDWISMSQEQKLMYAEAFLEGYVSGLVSATVQTMNIPMRSTPFDTLQDLMTQLIQETKITDEFITSEKLVVEVDISASDEATINAIGNNNLGLLVTDGLNILLGVRSR